MKKSEQLTLQPIQTLNPMDYNGRDIKVILADNNPDFIDDVQTVLSSTSGYELIFLASSSEELIECGCLHEADIILCDVEIPRMNGFDAAKHILSANPKMKLIALCAYTDELYIMDIIEAGFKAFIYKPQFITKFKTTTRKVLDETFSFPLWGKDRPGYFPN